MIITLYNIYTKKSDIIKENIEDEKNIFLNNIYSINDNFFMPFYELVLENAVADAYEYFIELESENNFFYKNISLLNRKKGHRFFRLIAMHHTIKFLKGRKDIFDMKYVKEILFKTFMFNENEKKVFELLFKCACEYEGEFQKLFAISIGKYLFNKGNLGFFTLAFIENFCYNSYNNFMQSFTKYISLNQRIKKFKLCN